MRLVTNGILVNEFGQVLLIQRNDTRTFAPPGGGVEAGELPTENIAREIREETGLIAMPVRLVSLNYWPLAPEGFLAFTFRCIQRGGSLQTSPESPRVGFYSTHPLPRPMLALSRKRIEQGLGHTGGAISWWVVPASRLHRLGRFFLNQVVYRWLDWKRKRQDAPSYQPPPLWNVQVYTVVQNKEGAVLQVQGEDGWQLPGGEVPGLQAPWDTAVTLTHTQTNLPVHLTDLAGVYVWEGSSRIILVFTAVAASPAFTLSNRAAWQPPPDNQAHLHRFIQDARTPDQPTPFRRLKPTLT